MLRSLILTFLISTAFAASPTPTLSYDAATVTLRGVIQRQIFPGRPEYADISKGDEPETYWILRLVRAVDVAASARDKGDVAEPGVREMQVVLSSTECSKYRSLVGKRVIVGGSLFHQITIHHKTP